MAPKKKPSKNGFWQFVMECRDKSTNRNMSMQEVQTYASRKWANMSKEEKKPYEDMAAYDRASYCPNRLTSDGRPIDEVEREEKDAEEKLRKMKAEVSNTLKSAALYGNLDEQRFLIIHINHMVYVPREDKYFICEIAVSAFSLRNGIEDVYHEIVKPGKLPLGFYGPAQAHSKETHQLIDLCQEEPFEDNTHSVFFNLVRFMRRFSAENKLPILYCPEKTLEMTTKVIETFRYDFNFPDAIKVYNMQYMFFALRNAAAGKPVWPTETLSYNEIEKDVYSYIPNISCEFHEVTDITIYCSKSVVTRYAYTICDNCCPDLGIQLMPGCHVPSKAKITLTNQSLMTSSHTNSVSNFSDIDYRPNNESRLSYEDQFPALRSPDSSAPASVVSFSSMLKTPKGSVKSATTFSSDGLEEAVNNMALDSSEVSKRDLSKLRFPKHR